MQVGDREEEVKQDREREYRENKGTTSRDTSMCMS